MAETTVTGQIGDQEVNLRNAASEATLQKLLEATLRQGGTSAGDRLQKLATDARTANTKTVTENKTAFVKNTDSVNKSAAAINNFSKGLMSQAGNVLGRTYDTLKGLGNELITGGDRVSDFTRHLNQLPLGLGFLGGMVDAVAVAIDDSLSTWRTLTETGAAFNNSIAEMRHSAAQAGMSVAEFGAFVSANTRTLSMFGSSTTEGVKNFARLSKELRRPGGVGSELMTMGYSLQDLNEVLLGYAEQEARMGRTRNLNDRNVINSAGAFAKELDLAAKVSGLSRKALLESSKAMSKDAGMRALLAGLDAKDAAVAKANITMVTGLFPDLAEGMTDLMDGIPQTEIGRFLEVFSGGEAGRLSQLAAKGLIDQAEYNNRLKALGEQMNRYVADNKQTIDAQRLIYPGLGVVVDNVGGLMSLTKKTREQMLKEAATRDNATEFFATFELFTRAFKTGMIDIIFASKAFGRIKAAFDGVANKTSDTLPKILDKMLGAFQSVVTWIDGFITDVEATSFSQVFKTRLTELADDLQVYATKFLKELFNIDERELHKNRGGEEGKSLSGAIMSRVVDSITPYVKQLGTVLVDGAAAALKSMGQKMLDELQSFWNNNQLITAVAAGIVGLFAAKKIAGIFGAGAAGAAGAAGSVVGNAGSALRGIAAGVSAFANPAALIGLTALVAAVNGLALAARIASPAFEPLGKMLKFTLDGLAPLVTSVFNGVNTFVATIGGTIVGVINGVTNGIAKLTDKTATINATTDQLERLSKIPSENLIGAAAGIERMKAALEGFTPGFFSGLSASIGSFFTGDQAEHITRLAEAGSKLNTATANLNIGKSFELPEGLEGRYKLFAEHMYNLAPSISAIAFTLDKVKMDPLQKLADLGSDLGNAAVGYAKFNDVAKQFDMSKVNITKDQIDRLSVGTTKIRDLTTMVNASTNAFKKLDDTGLSKIKSGIESLSTSFNDFNTSFVDNFMPLFEATRAETPVKLLTDANDKLNQLNTNIVTLISVQGEARNDLGKIAGNTNRGITGRSVY
jgi:hypothetical protein